MEVTKEAYSLLEAKLEEIEQVVNNGLINNNERLACLNVKNLVHEACQIMDENFIVDGNDEPPTA